MQPTGHDPNKRRSIEEIELVQQVQPDLVSEEDLWAFVNHAYHKSIKYVAIYCIKFIVHKYSWVALQPRKFITFDKF